MALSRETADRNLLKALAIFKAADARLTELRAAPTLNTDELSRATERYVAARIAHQQAIADVEACLP